MTASCLDLKTPVVYQVSLMEESMNFFVQLSVYSKVAHVMIKELMGKMNVT